MPDPTRTAWFQEDSLGQFKGRKALQMQPGVLKGETEVNSLQPHSGLLASTSTRKELSFGYILTDLILHDPILLLIKESRERLENMLATITGPVLQWADIERQFGPHDLFSDLIQHSEPEVVEEEEIYIHPTALFGTQPIPRTTRRIRLTPRIRSVIPPDNLPRTFALSLAEEAED